MLRELEKIHTQSVSRPIVHLTKNPSPDPATDECPICFTRYAEVLTNCHHAFCGECTVAHLQKSKGTDCPMCRQTINTLLYDNPNSFPHNTCRKINKNMGPFRFQHDSYTPDWSKKNAVISIKRKNENGTVFENYVENHIHAYTFISVRITQFLCKRKQEPEQQEPEKSLHQQCWELRQQGIYVRRNGFRFRRGDFVI